MEPHVVAEAARLHEIDLAEAAEAATAESAATTRGNTAPSPAGSPAFPDGTPWTAGTSWTGGKTIDGLRILKGAAVFLFLTWLVGGIVGFVGFWVLALSGGKARVDRLDEWLNVPGIEWRWVRALAPPTALGLAVWTLIGLCLFGGGWFYLVGRQPRWVRCGWWLCLAFGLCATVVMFFVEGWGRLAVNETRGAEIVVRYADPWAANLVYSAGLALLTAVWTPVVAYAMQRLRSTASGSTTTMPDNPAPRRYFVSGTATWLAVWTAALIGVYGYAWSYLGDQLTIGDQFVELRSHPSFAGIPRHERWQFESMFAPEVASETLTWYDSATGRRRSQTNPLFVPGRETLSARARAGAGTWTWGDDDRCVVKIFEETVVTVAVVEGDRLFVRRSSNPDAARTPADINRQQVGLWYFGEMPDDMRQALTKSMPLGAKGGKQFTDPNAAKVFRPGYESMPSLEMPRYAGYLPWVERRVQRAGWQEPVTTTHRLSDLWANVPSALEKVAGAEGHLYLPYDRDSLPERPGLIAGANDDKVRAAIAMRDTLATRPRLRELLLAEDARFKF